MDATPDRGDVPRLDHTAERSVRPLRMFRRLRLRRADGDIYLDRWGLAHERLGGVLLHRMSAPDPGIDLHDHPWWFVTIPLLGGYREYRASVREAPGLATIADRFPTTCTRGAEEHRRWLRPRRMRLDECHRIFALDRPVVWTLVIRGPRVRRWGFYLPVGYLDERTYDVTVGAGRRDLWSDKNVAAVPW